MKQTTRVRENKRERGRERERERNKSRQKNKEKHTLLTESGEEKMNILINCPSYLTQSEDKFL